MAEPAQPARTPIEGLPDLEADARRIAALALAEDGVRDVTSEVVGAAGRRAGARIELREPGVVAGIAYADAVARARGCAAEWEFEEGAALSGPGVIGWLRGDLAEVLRVERPLLNLLQRACGIAAATRAFVSAVAGTGCRVLHTRKTTPGLRGLEVRAVLAGGGTLHRVGLGDAVLIKDNHWQLLDEAAGLDTACRAARARGIERIYVEVESEPQVRLACAAGATRLLIDNQPPATVRRFGDLARSLAPGIEIEATGGITLTNVRDYALAGAGFVSVGALTHSVRAADVAVELCKERGVRGEECRQ